MRPLYLPDDVQAMDQRAFARGVDPAALMDRAAQHLARGVLRLLDERVGRRYGARVVLLCAKGNNGGDGIAAARHLARRGVACTVALVLADAPADPGDLDAVRALLGDDAARELAAWDAAGDRWRDLCCDRVWESLACWIALFFVCVC